MKCIIAGSRDIESEHPVFDAIARSDWLWQITEVICGGAKGGDAFGDAYAKFIGLPVTYFLVTDNGAFDYARLRNLRLEPGVRHLPGQPATFENVCVASDWRHDGPAAGPLRNKRMAQYAAASGGVLIAVRKGNSPGTTNMIATAEKYGLPTYVEELP